MNIHIGKEMFDTLMASTIGSYEFGSTLYELSTDTSDVDIMHIFVPSDNMEKSYVWDNSMFQYKEDGVDHIFTTIDGFIRNLLTGDSTINFEILHSENNFEILGFLFNNKKMFYNYSVLRAYLGFAKRDLKLAKDPKKMAHAIRGYNAAYSLYHNNTYNNISSESDKEHILFYKSGNKASLEHIFELKEKVEKLRDKVNIDFDSGKIYRYSSVSDLARLDNWVFALKSSDKYMSKKQKFIDITSIYDALENGVSYA